MVNGLYPDRLSNRCGYDGDQTMWVSRTEAEAAMGLLNGKDRIRNGCDNVQPKIEDVKKVNITDAGDGGWLVKVNGEAIDLACIYFLAEDGRWKNVASQIGIQSPRAAELQ